jgi:predicted nucleic acid-binding protein
VDSSVVVKWFLRDGEPNVRDAWELLEGHQAGELLLAAPDHMRLEVLNALWSRDLDEADLLEARRVLDGFSLMLRPLDAELADATVRIARRTGLTMYDSAFAALALLLDAELVTADRRLADAQACQVRLL